MEVLLTKEERKQNLNLSLIIVLGQTILQCLILTIGICQQKH